MIFMSEIKAGITVCIVSLFSICLRSADLMMGHKHFDGVIHKDRY